MRPLMALWIAALPLGAQVCTHVQDGLVDTAYYEKNRYVVSKIVLHQTFDFLSFVRRRLDRLKTGLALKEGEPYFRDADDASFHHLEDALDDDSAYGTLPFKVTAGLARIKNCNESAQPGTLEIHYDLFSTDPFSAAVAPPESQAGQDRDPAKAAQNTTHSASRFIPSAMYDRTDRLAIGGTVKGNLQIPGFRSITMSSLGSSSTRAIQAQLSGERDLGMRGLDHLDYRLQYAANDQPAGRLQLQENVLSLQAVASTKAFTLQSGNKIAGRYGLSIGSGNQQSTAAETPPGTLARSHEGDIRLLVGTTYTTRYTGLAASYALRISGAGLDSLASAANIADAKFDWRQGKTHTPWDIGARATAGIIAGSRDILLNSRFFGGNAVAPVLPGDSWMVPYGPLVRSIPRNRLNGLGYGGTSFYSTNLTIGKVLKSSPLIPAEIEKAPGFCEGITAAENTAETFFADDYETKSGAYKAMVAKFGAQFVADLTDVQQFLHGIPPSAPVSNAGKHTRDALRVARTAKSDPLALKTYTNPAKSTILQLVDDLGKIAPTVPALQQAQLNKFIADLRLRVEQLKTAIAEIDQSSIAEMARLHAKRDMKGPREVIDTLRHEADIWSVSAVGIFDAGRLWPDPNGTRYAIGAGGRFSVLSVNFTAGYAFNPQPYRLLGQGRGALFFALTYTNLFR